MGVWLGRDLVWRVAALAALLACTSCGAGTLALPSKGGPPWREHRSDHFTIKTDLPIEDGQKLASELEEVHALLNTVIANGKASDVKCTVVVFRSRSQYLPFVSSAGVYGLYFPGSPIDLDPEPTFTTSERLDKQNRIVLTHELTHRFLSRILGPTPIWLNEGLAEYYSTAHAENGKAIVGEPNLLRGFTRLSVPVVQDFGTHKRLLLPLELAIAITRFPEAGLSLKAAKAALEALAKYSEAAAQAPQPAASVPSGDAPAPRPAEGKGRPVSAKGRPRPK